jgi:aspartate carbamoyltransferase regulatory subunit
MPRYHINIFNDVDVIDEEGVELPDLATAKARAIRGGRAIMADHVKAGRPLRLFHRIEIVDDGDKVLTVIPFRELITLEDHVAEVSENDLG